MRSFGYWLLVPGICGFFDGDQQLRRFVPGSSNKAYTCCKEKNAKNAVGQDLPDMMAAASSIDKVNSCNDQTNDP